MSMFWWLVKNEQLRYYRNRNAEFQRREKERKQKEEQEKQWKAEQYREYLRLKKLGEKTDALKHEILDLKKTIGAIKYPTLYSKDNQIVVDRNLLISLNHRVNSLKKQQSLLKECDHWYTMEFESIIRYFDEIKKEYSEYFNENVEQKQQNKKPNKLSNPVLYNKLAHNIKNKKFKNEKEKMKMIKIIGASGLTTEERKSLISMIK